MKSGSKSKRKWIGFFIVLIGTIILLLGLIGFAVNMPGPIPELVIMRPQKPAPSPISNTRKATDLLTKDSMPKTETPPAEDSSTTQPEQLSNVEKMYLMHSRMSFPGNSIVKMEAIQFRDDKDGVRVCYPIGYTQGGMVNIDDVVHIKAGEAAQLPEGVIDIKWVGVGYHTGPSDDMMVDLKHYTPQGEPLDAESIANLPDWAFRCKCDKNNNVLLFGGDLEGIENYHFIEARLLNRWGNYWFPNQSFVHHPSALASVETYLWYDMEAVLILDFAHGPIEEYDLPMEPGFMITIDDMTLKLLAVSSGKPSKINSGFDSLSYLRDESMGECYGKFFNIDKTATQQTFVVIACSNETQNGLFELAAYDENDAELEVNKVYMEGYFVESPLQQIKRLAIRCLPRRTRLIATLPHIPGLPAENDNIDNILQVHIPYIKIETELEWSRLVSEYISVKMGESGEFIDWRCGDILPLELTDTTPYELIVMYSKYYDPRPRISMDEANSLVKFDFSYRDAFMYKAWEAIKETYFFWQ